MSKANHRVSVACSIGCPSPVQPRTGVCLLYVVFPSQLRVSGLAFATPASYPDLQQSLNPSRVADTPLSGRYGAGGRATPRHPSNLRTSLRFDAAPLSRQKLPLCLLCVV